MRGGVIIYMGVSQHIQLISKPKKEAPKLSFMAAKETFPNVQAPKRPTAHCFGPGKSEQHCKH